MASTTFSGPVTSTNGFITPGTIVVGGNTITGTELGYVDGVTPGTATASKALVLNASKGISTITSATITDLTVGSTIVSNTSGGVKIGTATNQKIAFFNSAPVAQQATTGTTTGFTAGSGTASKSDSTYTGNTGSTAYTVGDIVLALKNLGLLAA